MLNNETLSKQVKTAIDLLQSGGVVAIPTETVYGLACAINKPEAIDMVYRIKNRPTQHPLIMHIANEDDLFAYTSDVPSYVNLLIKYLWPGPLTLVLKKNENVPYSITGGQDSVAIRMPNQKILQQIIYEIGVPIAAPSANKFGGISPTDASHVIAEFDNQIEVVDGGRCQHGIESTIIDVRDSRRCTILRPGPISKEMLAKILSLNDEQVDIIDIQNKNIRFPGNYKKHYAPTKKLIAFRNIDELTKIQEKYHQAYIIHHSDFILDTGKSFRMDLNTIKYSREIYKALRTADQSNCEIIFIERPPLNNEWIAINDRLNRAITLDYSEAIN
jgi:L-threonylcarbamoyladenylate synthase